MPADGKVLDVSKPTDPKGLIIEAWAQGFRYVAQSSIRTDLRTNAL